MKDSETTIIFPPSGITGLVKSFTIHTGMFIKVNISFYMHHLFLSLSLSLSVHRPSKHNQSHTAASTAASEAHCNVMQIDRYAYASLELFISVLIS